MDLTPVGWEVLNVGSDEGEAVVVEYSISVWSPLHPLESILSGRIFSFRDRTRCLTSVLEALFGPSWESPPCLGYSSIS